MSTKQSKPVRTLWFNSDRTQHFLIPDDYQLPEGQYVLHSRDGRQRHVAVDAVGRFRVQADAVEAWAQQELGRVLAELGGNLRRAFASVPPEGVPTDTPATPGLDLLAAITKTPRADLDTGALGGALKRYLGDIGSTVADAMSGDPARIEQSKARMAEWSATLREHGTEVGGPEPAAGTAPETGTGVGAASAEADKEPQQPPGKPDPSGIAASLHALAEQFRQRADALAAARVHTAAPPTTSTTGPNQETAAHRTGDPTQASSAVRAGVVDDESAGPAGSGDTGHATDGPSASPSPAEIQAAAIEALATGLEDAAGDAAARLRAQAARLRAGPQR